ncbi:hypothetical protein BS47DRAFT_1389575 [Hydnum rufescens UP504]|uniref:Uncharacterized protein n=1 Tax=Hydnum rufescens UP504 TaxID=1448309 RepID=A0A9P6B5E4_9AGAM|nr:hypothetical protein BS47DRAFT_1389575 [Hydnum rufescens UP504]
MFVEDETNAGISTSNIAYRSSPVFECYGTSPVASFLPPLSVIGKKERISDEDSTVFEDAGIHFTAWNSRNAASVLPPVAPYELFFCDLDYDSQLASLSVSAVR